MLLAALNHHSLITTKPKLNIMAPNNRRTGKQTKKSALFDDEEKKLSDDDLVLTSEKRRGVYECDFCRTDISQLPRIRCAVCPDFDLCLECFMFPPNETSHDPTHGYRVCDSTRYPLFPTSRNLQSSSLSAKAPTNDEQAVNGGDKELKGDGSEANEEKVIVDHTKQEREELADEMDVDTKSETLDSSKHMSIRDGACPTDDDGASDVVLVQTDDRKSIWTVEEDLRLLEGIKMHGLAK